MSALPPKADIEGLRGPLVERFRQKLCRIGLSGRAETGRTTERLYQRQCEPVSSSRHSEPAERCPAEHVIALIGGEFRKDAFVGVV